MPVWIKLLLGALTIGVWTAGAPEMFHLNGNYNHDYYVCTH